MKRIKKAVYFVLAWLLIISMLSSMSVASNEISKESHVDVVGQDISENPFIDNESIIT